MNISYRESGLMDKRLEDFKKKSSNWILIRKGNTTEILVEDFKASKSEFKYHRQYFVNAKTAVMVNKENPNTEVIKENDTWKSYDIWYHGEKKILLITIWEEQELYKVEKAIEVAEGRNKGSSWHDNIEMKDIK